VAQPTEFEEVEGLDEEFLYHLNRGSELLTRGELVEAHRSLQRAAHLRPRDGKVLGLLGQACYRMGRFVEAAEAYGRLVDESPTEVAARVNLGLANLKARRHSEAVRQLSISLDLNPDHRKAMGYLGLAHLESGNPVAARGWFQRAGSQMMVARCDEAIARAAAGEPPGAAPGQEPAGPERPPGKAEEERPAAREAPAVEAAEAGPAPAPEASAAPEEARAGPEEAAVPLQEEAAAGARGGPEVVAAGAVAAPDVAAASAATAAEAVLVEVQEDLGEGALDEPEAPARESAAGGGAAARAPGGPAPAGVVLPRGGLVAFADRRMLRPQGGTFAVEAPALSVAVRGEVLVRLEGIFAARGKVALRPEVKRFRGQPTDKPFGMGAERMYRAIGEGSLLYRSTGRVFTPVDLGGEAGYFREEVVFALEAGVAYENGRVPARQGPDMNLVHLSGDGQVLLDTWGEPAALEVTPGTPLRVPVDVLVGWTGALTPRLAVLGGEPEAGGSVVVELTGDGRAILDPDAPPRE
jgi:hypothetical protein